MIGWLMQRGIEPQSRRSIATTGRTAFSPPRTSLSIRKTMSSHQKHRYGLRRNWSWQRPPLWDLVADRVFVDSVESTLFHQIAARSCTVCPNDARQKVFEFNHRVLAVSVAGLNGRW
jgi:hypothetical protein